MCEQCTAKTISYGEVIPGWAIVQATVDGNIMAAGDWGLTQMSDPTFVWEIQPRRDPFDGWTDDQVDASTDDEWEQSNLFQMCVSSIKKAFNCRPDIGYDLVHAATKAGFVSEEGGFMHWLVHRMAVTIETHVPIE